MTTHNQSGHSDPRALAACGGTNPSVQHRSRAVNRISLSEGRLLRKVTFLSRFVAKARRQRRLQAIARTDDPFIDESSATAAKQRQVLACLQVRSSDVTVRLRGFCLDE